VCKSWSSSLCSFLQPPVTSSLFCPNIILNTVLRHPQSMFLLSCQRPSFAPIQNHRRLIISIHN
jgi:hypothetical protein